MARVPLVAQRSVWLIIPFLFLALFSGCATFERTTVGERYLTTDLTGIAPDPSGKELTDKEVWDAFEKSARNRLGNLMNTSYGDMSTLIPVEPNYSQVGTHARADGYVFSVTKGWTWDLGIPFGGSSTARSYTLILIYATDLGTGNDLLVDFELKKNYVPTESLGVTSKNVVETALQIAPYVYLASAVDHALEKADRRMDKTLRRNTDRLVENFWSRGDVSGQRFLDSAVGRGKSFVDGLKGSVGFKFNGGPVDFSLGGRTGSFTIPSFSGGINLR